MIQKITEKVLWYFKLAYIRLSICFSSDGLYFGAWHFSLMAFLWGVWMLSPWGGIASTSGYAPMALLASEFTWGALATVLGGVNMHFVVVNKKISLAIFSMLLGYFWSLVGISFLIGNISSAGGVVYLMIALFNFWVYKRLHG